METQTDAQSVENFQSIFSRIGQLTRVLRDSMTNLGLDRAIMEAADAIPDARDRLNYIVGKTSQAADRALNCVEIARPLQDELNDKANALTDRWDAWFVEDLPLSAAKELVIDTRSFLKFAPTIATQTNAQLMEIMMAQDFQDLTGQVIQRMMRLIESLEKELIQVLVENMPDSEALMTEDAVELKNGPQIDQSKAGIVASQDQVDDLLESLGF